MTKEYMGVIGSEHCVSPIEYRIEQKAATLALDELDQLHATLAERDAEIKRLNASLEIERSMRVNVEDFHRTCIIDAYKLLGIYDGEDDEFRFKWVRLEISKKLQELAERDAEIARLKEYYEQVFKDGERQIKLHKEKLAATELALSQMLDRRPGEKDVAYRMLLDTVGEKIVTKREQALFKSAFDCAWEAHDVYIKAITTQPSTAHIEAYVEQKLKERMGEPVAWRDPSNISPEQGCTYQKAVSEAWPHIYTQALYAIEADVLAKQKQQTWDAERWQPIETAPKAGEVVLVSYICNGQLYWAEAAKQKFRVWFRPTGQAVNQPTHWMPLPNPPVIDAARKGE